MTRKVLAVFEGDGTDGYSAFALDFPNTGGMGETLEETRDSLLKGIGYCLEEPVQLTDYLNSSPRVNVDFSEFDPDRNGHYVIEWLNVEVPVSSPAAQDA